MATLSKSQIETALSRLGEMAARAGSPIRLVLVGGGAMVLAFGARESTRDLDVAILAPADHAAVRMMAERVAQELQWRSDWLNDAAKGFLVGLSVGPVIFASNGIEVLRPATEQLLAMKLCAWRDDLDISDARRLLDELTGNQQEVWKRVVPFLQPGEELKAQYAFEDLWSTTNDHD